MKPLPTPRRLLTLHALFARRQPLRGVTEAAETRLPDLPERLALQPRAGTQLGRLAAEVALEEGGRRQYAPRSESQVLEGRR